MILGLILSKTGLLTGYGQYSAVCGYSVCNYKKLYNRFHDGEAVWTSYVGGTGCSCICSGDSCIIYNIRHAKADRQLWNCFL
jgi:hypothetical protein